jgi:hypothetical protein
MNKRRLIQALLFVIFVPTISGCRRDPLVDALERDKEEAKAKGFREFEEHSELALSRLRNRVIDPEPILLIALLGRETGSGRYLHLETFDEDRDILGLGIREEHTDVNGLKTVLTEEYPAFVHRMTSEVLLSRLCAVKIRDADQRKNAQLWDGYVKGEGIDVSSLQSRDYWIETLPPLWISIPETNRVDVYVYLYDKAGHKSDPVKLRAASREGDYKPTPEQLFWRKVRMDRQRSVEKVP